MAKQKRFAPADDMLAIINATKPATPILMGKERTYYKGLKRRGFSEQQINEFIKKAGYPVPADLWTAKAKKPVAAPVQAR
jgi:hypothetical protein